MLRAWPLVALVSLITACDRLPAPNAPVTAQEEPTVEAPPIGGAPSPAYDFEADVEPPAPPRARMVPTVARPDHARIKPRARALLITEIQALSSLFASTAKNAPERPKLIRRLAEGYRELEQSARLEVPIASKPEEKSRLEAVAQGARREAIKHGLLLTSQYPTWCVTPNASHPELSTGCGDEALLALGEDYERAGDHDSARKQYLQLVQDWPKSRFTDEAYGAFGEMFAGDAMGDPVKWQFARQSYQEALKSGAPDANAAYWTYKLAYVDWHLGDYPAALGHFKQLFDIAAAHPDVADRDALLADARADIVPPYAHAGNAAKSYEFFGTLVTDKSQLQALLESLGREYLAADRFDDALTVYDDLAARHPTRRFGYDRTLRAAAARLHVDIDAARAKRAARP